jgi:mono/diheme cytochrome c family protein
VKRFPGNAGVPPAFPQGETETRAASVVGQVFDLILNHRAGQVKDLTYSKPSPRSFPRILQAGRPRSQGIAFALVFVAAFTSLARAGYMIENVAYPAELRGGISSVTFTPAGSLVISTRLGEVWMRDATAGGKWRLFMRGLDEPMGLVAESERVIYVAHRPEILRASDTDGDGRAETFDAVGGKWGQSINYHEFFFGLKRDRAGNFYGAPSLDSAAEKGDAATRPARGARNYDPVLEPAGHRSETSWRGWVIRVTPDGKFEPLASGFRQPNGIALSPNDELFVTDNQGDYKPSTGLLHIEKGDFHGHAESVKWEAGYDAAKLTTEALWRRLKTPAVVFPHGPMGISPGEPVWDVSAGKFGPFAGQVFTGDYSRLVIRASLEKIAGAWQGACFPFLGRNESPSFVKGTKLKAGATRAAFGPDGSLYLAATAGWGAGEDGLQRVSWDGNPIAEIRDVKLTDRGFVVSFTRPISAATIAKSASYELNRFRYYYHVKYGSPWIDEARVAVKEVHAAADGLSAELVLAELKPGFIYELSVPTLRTTNAEPLANPLAYYTANRLLNGERTIGGTTRLPRPDETSLAAKEAIAAEAASPEALVAAGEKTYRMFCVGCHQPDGRGVVGGAANFLEDKTRLAKPDAELLDVIAKGNEAKAMPAFGAILSVGQRRAVLAYIRETFGGKK